MSGQTAYILDFQDVRKIRQTWTNIQNNNKYHKDLFVTRAYANLIAGSPFLKYIFTTDAMMREHSLLFGEMLSSVVTYLHSPIMVNEYLTQFINKNEEFIANAVKYLEPMGVALTQTIKQWIGKIDPELECAWVQLYLYIAVFIMDNTQYPDADLSSCANSTSGEEASPTSRSYASVSPSNSDQEADDVQPLNIKRLNTWTSSPPSVVSSGSSCSDGSGILQIDLRKNEKYKGFRRDSNSSLFEVKIPTSSTFEKPPLITGMTTPRASSPSNASFASFGTAISTVGHVPFDPRGHKKSSSRFSMTDSLSSNTDTDVPVRRRPFMSQDQFTDYDTNYGTAAEDLEDYMSSTFGSSGSSNSDNDRNDRANTMNTFSSDSTSSTTTTTTANAPRFKFKKPTTVITNDDDVEFTEKEPKGFGFDPRQKGHRRNNSVSVSPENSPTTTGSQWRIVDDEEDPYAGEISAARTASRLPPRLLDHSSFGLKGLSVIEETEDDDTASSRYEDDTCTRSSNYSGDVSGTASSHEEESSEASTLSLHNSDYSLAMEVNNLSSTASRKQASPVLESTLSQLQPPPVPPKMSSIHSGSSSGSATVSGVSSAHTVATAMSQGVYRNKLASSSSLLVGTAGSSNQKRVSLGFMRSSYVLKKEMEEHSFGSSGSSPAHNPFGSPERSASLTSLRARSSVDLTEHMSRNRTISGSSPYVTRLNQDEDTTTLNYTTTGGSLIARLSPTQSLLDLDPRKGGFAPCGISNKYAKNSVQKSMGCVPITQEVGFREKGFKAAFIALFSGGNNKSHIKASREPNHKSPMLKQSIQTILQNIEQHNKAAAKQNKSQHMEKPLPPNPNGKLYKLSTSSIYSFKKFSESSSSVNSSDSSVSGFSFFNKKKNDQYITASKYTKRNPKKNKYSVTSTPYSIL